MSTEIKPGQVWAWSPSIDADESQFRIMTVDANRVRYEYLRESDPHVEGGFTHAPATIREKCRLVTDVDTTPAPLDPSKVKAGDTAMLFVAPAGHAPTYTVIGEAYLTSNGVYVGGWPVADSRVTLTDHQPAPEPEPEWEPNFAVVHPGDNPGVEWCGFVDNDGDFYGMEDNFRREASKGDYIWVRPLVVIDPAAVDAFDLASRAVANLRDKGRTPDIDDAQTYIREALAELGLDGAS